MIKGKVERERSNKKQKERKAQNTNNCIIQNR